MIRYYPTTIFVCLLITIIASGSVFQFVSAQTTNPTALAPSSNTTSPLNTGTNTQQKTGSLIIGASSGIGQGSKLCLNASSIADTINCISAWSSVPTPRFISLTQALLSNAEAEDPANYVQQIGYIDIKSGANQVTASISASDVNTTGLRGTAVYGSSSTNTGYAGFFGGRVSISNGRLCLGAAIPPVSADGVGAADGCINSWLDLTNGPVLYVQRQTINPPTPQANGAAISGSSQFRSVVLGSTAGLNLPLQVTCGNGICDKNITTPETATTCPADCSTAPSSPTTFSPNLDSTGTLLNYKVNLPVSATAVGSMLIVRSKTNAPTFLPMNGVNYVVGTTVGNNAIVVANQATSSIGQALLPIDTLNNQTVRAGYFYQAFQANAYYQYSMPTAAIKILPYQLRTAVTPASGRGVMISSPGGINCGAGCSAIYNAGSTVVLSMNVIQAGYEITGWSQECSLTNGGQCTVVMNNDIYATVVISPCLGNCSGGDGGGDNQLDGG